MSSDLFEFAPEEPQEPSAGAALLRILSVDDDRAFQQNLAFSLRDYRYQGHPVELLYAQSMQQGALMVTQHPDIAVILLDVVMETDDAGLQLVRSVRETLGNHAVRIVLVTGQPGLAPMRTTIENLDINDYWTKTELTADRLASTLTACLRDWQHLTAMARARRGLQLIVESSDGLLYAHNLREFCDRVLAQLAGLLEVAPDGLVCAEDNHRSEKDLQIVAASGCYERLSGRGLDELEHAEVVQALSHSLQTRTDLQLDDAQTLFIAGPPEGADCAVFIHSPGALAPTETDLLRVFGTHASSGLINLSLVSRLDRIAYQDLFLQIPNRNALLRTLRTLHATAQVPPHSLLLVDIDEFSHSNLALGMEQGNHMLQMLAQLLSTTFPPPVQVARLHDDVFAVLGPAELIGEAHIAALQAADQPINVSIGRLDLQDFHGPLEDALPAISLVLKQAKKRGFRQFATYRSGLEEQASQRYILSRELHQAIQDDALCIHLQPQVDLASGRIVSAEALARWPRPDGTQVPPDHFIPMAEANGDIGALGNLVLRHAVAAIRQISTQLGRPFRIAVNLSALQLARDDLVEALLALCAQSSVSPQQLELEVTESVAMQGEGAAIEQLHRLRQAGFPISIDDFGTGFSSLAYLRELPAGVLKIDRCFINEIGHVDDDAAIADMILRLAKRLRLTVVAEGIENAAQRAWLHARGCDLGQGYFFDRPLPLSQLLERLDDNLGGTVT